MNTRARNISIVLLLIVGIGMFLVMELSLKPHLRATQTAYERAQGSPLTHDITSVLSYQSPYMGDNSNDINLNAHLPLANVPRTYQLFPGKREMRMDFSQQAHVVPENRLKSSLVYDATANFALIGNLNSITFRFPDVSYHVTRDTVAKWYGLDPLALSSLTVPKAWSSKVQRKLQSHSYVDEAFGAMFGI